MKSSADHSTKFETLSRRFLAVLADLAASYMLFYTLLSFNTYELKYGSLSLWLHKLFGLKGSADGMLLSEWLGTGVFVFGIYLVIRFYSTLILGVSLSQWLLGLRGLGNSVWKRIGGGARVVLELFFAPLLVGELLLLFNRPSIKESISHTRLVAKPKKLSLYLGLIWVPGLLIFSTISPLFEGLTLIDGISISPVKDNLNLKSQGNFSNFTNYSSNRFKFQAFSSLADGRFIILPGFEVIKEGSSKKIKPYMRIYDQKKKLDAYVKIEQRFSLFRALEKGKLGNPFFKSQFPNLHEALNKDREEFLKKKYRKEYEGEMLIDDKVRSEIEKLVKTSLSLGSGNIWGHLFEYGPFYRGFVAVKNELLDKAFSGITPEIDFGKIGSNKFLRYKQLFAEKVFLDKRMVETYIPIETNNSLALRFYWGEGLDSAISRKTFRDSFLQTIEWYFDYFTIFPFPQKSEEVNSLTVLDHFTKTDLVEKERDLLEEAIFRMYFKLGRRSLQEADEKLQEVLSANLGRIHLVASLINEQKKNYYTKKFLVHLKDLKFSIKNKDFNYYGLKTL